MRKITNSNGDSVCSYRYYPFGGALTQSETKPNELKFTEKPLVAGIDAYDFSARYYDPEIARFYALDPIPSGGSPYAYCGNNPILYVDPSGMATVPAMTQYPEDYGTGSSAGGGDFSGRESPYYTFGSGAGYANRRDVLTDASGSTNWFGSAWQTTYYYMNGSLAGYETSFWDEAQQGYVGEGRYNVTQVNIADLVGKIIVESGSGWSEGWISIFCGDATHTSMVALLDGVIGKIEAVSGGVEFNPIGNWLFVAGIYQPTGTEIGTKAATEWAASMRGTPYDLSGAIGFGAFGISSFDNPSTMYCSELQGRAYNLPPRAWRNPGTLNTYMTNQGWRVW